MYPYSTESRFFGNWLDEATGLKGVHITGTICFYLDTEMPAQRLSFTAMRICQNILRLPQIPMVRSYPFSVDNVTATIQAIIKLGGSAVGKLTVRDFSGLGIITFQYLTDPEENIIEIQRWEKIT